MTDLEMIKKCADRMDYKVALDIHGTFFFVTDGTKQPDRKDYDPLNNDDQAMELFRKYHHVLNFDLRRAIVEAVANLP